MNPRFAAYAKAHGRSPGAQLKHDRSQYPGGSMCGFICWIQGRITAFRREHPEAFVGDAIRNQAAFTRFLAKAKAQS